MSSVNNTFISREHIERESNKQLPKFYDQKVETILNNVQASLNQSIGSGSKIRVPNQQSTSRWYHYIPQSISIGNTTNYASPFSFANFSSTTVNANESRVSAKPKTEAEKEKEKEEAENRKRQMFGVVSGFFMLAASYLVGQSIQELREADEDLEDLKDLKVYVTDTKNQRQNLYPEQINQTSSVSLDEQLNMLENVANNAIIPGRKTNALRDLAIRTSLFTGGVIGIIGAFVVHSKPIMKFSGAWLLMTGCAWAIKKGFNSSTVKFNKTVETINQDIRSLLKVLSYLPRQNKEGVVTISPRVDAGYIFADPSVVYFNHAPSAPPVDNQGRVPRF